jgi:uncharacterized protein (DUF2141 family)
MVYIFDTGITSAAPIRALAVLTLFASLGGAAAPGSLDAGLQGFRSEKGNVLACLTTHAEKFPNCQDDPNARRMTVATRMAGSLKFEGLPSGTYALALIHDENGNGKLDTVMGIPREGFGFSNNPAIRFGPPSFKSAGVLIASGVTDETIRIKYLF